MEHPFARNVFAGEVSCRAGTIKCSRLTSLAPIPFRSRGPENFGSPADRTEAAIKQTKNAEKIIGLGAKSSLLKV